MLRITRAPALAIALLTLALAGPAYARTQYPYTLVDPGTFGGPSSFFDGPGVPLGSEGALVGAADTSTADSDYPNCAPPGGCSDPYVQHAFVWKNGQLTDLGALPGENSSAIYELNSYGVGVGSSENGLEDPNTGAAAQIAVMFKHGHVTNLGTLPGGNESFAQDINNEGQVAGNTSNGTPDPFSFFGWGTETRGFIWQHGVMTDLGTLGGADAVQNNLNEHGQIAGWSYANDTPNAATGLPTTDPFLWQNGHMRDLGALGGTLGFANWMNDRGEVVGQSDLAGDQTAHPFLWNGRRMIDLGTLGGDNGYANWVNNTGNVIGNAQMPGGSWNGFLWHEGKLVDLPPVDGAPWSGANSINDQGQIVGTINDTSGDQLAAVLWSKGNAYDLNTLVAPSSLQLINGEYVNDQGDIVCTALLNGARRIVMLTPNRSVPRPPASTIARPLTNTGVRDQHPSAVFALTTARHGIRAGIRQLMLSLRR